MGGWGMKWLQGRGLPAATSACWAPAAVRTQTSNPTRRNRRAALQGDGRLPDAAQPRFTHNASGRFESRWSMVAIDKDPKAMLLKGMGGARIGVWVAHGEGKATFPDGAVRERVLQSGLAPIRYCDQAGTPTEAYPANPNGSPAGIAALCSDDGRHLALMPHPERCFLAWQHPYLPAELGLAPAGPGPWLRLFQNAREWCEGTQR